MQKCRMATMNFCLMNRPHGFGDGLPTLPVGVLRVTPGGSMFDSFVLAVAVAIVALIVAIRALNQVAALRARLDALQAPATSVVPPPIPTYEFPVAPPIATAE